MPFITPKIGNRQIGNVGKCAQMEIGWSYLMTLQVNAASNFICKEKNVFIFPINLKVLSIFFLRINTCLSGGMHMFRRACL